MVASAALAVLCAQGLRLGGKPRLLEAATGIYACFYFLAFAMLTTACPVAWATPSLPPGGPSADRPGEEPDLLPRGVAASTPACWGERAPARRPDRRGLFGGNRR